MKIIPAEERMMRHPRSFTDFSIGVGYDVRVIKNAIVVGAAAGYKRTFANNLKTNTLPGIGARTFVFSLRLSHIFSYLSVPGEKFFSELGRAV